MLLSTLLSPCLTSLKIELSHALPSYVLHHILDSIQHKTGGLKHLSLCRHDRNTHSVTHDPDSQASELPTSSLVFWRNFVELETLTLDPASITVELLDAIGDLPKLQRLLALSEVVHFPEASLKKRKKKFRRLDELHLEIKFDDLEKILNAYFLPSAHFTNLQLRIVDSPFEPSNFNFLTAISKTVKILRLDLSQQELRAPTIECFYGLAKCNQLTKLEIEVWQRLSFERHQFSALFESCHNLTVLIILEKRELDASGIRSSTTPMTAPFRPCADLGLDLSCLDLIALHMPKMQDLHLSVTACDTSTMMPDSHLTRLKVLKRLRLRTSFVNWRVEGFNLHHASRYLSAIISPTSSFEILTLQIKNFPGQWEGYAKNYNEFVKEFKQIVGNYMEIRRGEAHLEK